jgi:hypothetical protein
LANVFPIGKAPGSIGTVEDRRENGRELKADMIKKKIF